VQRSQRCRNAQTSGTLRRGALRSTACATRPATVQTSGAPVGATRLPIPVTGPDRRNQPGQCLRLAMTPAAPSRLTKPWPDPGRAARGPPGTDRRRAAPRVRDRSGGTRPSLASRRRCTRPASSLRGTAQDPARARRARRARHLACRRRAASRPGRQARTPGLVRLMQSARAWTGLTADVRARRERPGRSARAIRAAWLAAVLALDPRLSASRTRGQIGKGPRRTARPRRGITTRTKALALNLATPCSRSVTRPRT
jgi:hypothetical protein